MADFNICQWSKFAKKTKFATQIKNESKNICYAFVASKNPKDKTHVLKNANLFTIFKILFIFAQGNRILVTKICIISLFFGCFIYI